jgi:hypothetical protein
MHLKTLAPILFFFLFLTAHAQQTTSTESTEVVDPAKSSDEKKAEVVIAGMKNPELKPYRILSVGMDAYDEYRHLAPQAPLLFQLRPRDRSDLSDFEPVHSSNKFSKLTIQRLEESVTP